MTVIRPNSISGITSLTAHRGSIDFYAHDGSAATFNNINSNVTSGVSTFASLNITGDLTVDGTTTTLDTVVTEVDRLEVSANSTVAAGIITQTGSGDILRLFDGASEVFSVADGGAVKIGGAGQLALDVSYDGSSATAAKIVTNTGITNANSTFTFAVNENSGAQMQLKGDGAVIFSEGSTERLRIDSAGKIGIGTNNPQRLLHLQSTGDTLARITSADGSSAYLELGDVSDPDGGKIVYDNGSNLTFYSASSERLRITSDGKVGINDDPERKFHVNSGADNECARFESTDTEVTLEFKDSTGTASLKCRDDFRFNSSTGEKLRITSGGQLNLAGNMQFTAADPELEFNNGGPRFRVPAPNTLTIHTGGGLGATTNERLRIASDGQATFDKGAPGSSNQVIARFQAESSRRLDIVWHDSGSLMGFDTPSSHSYIFKVGGSEKLRITSTGNIAVGTTGPFGGNVNNRRHFTLNGTSDVMLQWGINGTDRGYLYADATNLSIINTQNGYLRFNTNDTERFRIAANGRITAQVIFGTPLSGTTRDVFIEDGGQLGYLNSIREAKVNINLLSNVDWIYQLQPSSFNYKLTDQEGAYTGEVNPELEYGLIAEDVEPVAPELCFYDEVDGEQELRGVHYKKLIVPMLKALQEANAKIEALEAAVAELQGS